MELAQCPRTFDPEFTVGLNQMVIAISSVPIHVHSRSDSQVNSRRVFPETIGAIFPGGPLEQTTPRRSLRLRVAGVVNASDFGARERRKCCVHRSRARPSRRVNSRLFTECLTLARIGARFGAIRSAIEFRCVYGYDRRCAARRAEGTRAELMNS